MKYTPDVSFTPTTLHVIFPLSLISVLWTWCLLDFVCLSINFPSPFPSVSLSAQLNNRSSSAISTPVPLHILSRSFCHSGLVNVPTSSSDASLFLSVCSTVLSKFAYLPVYFIPVLPLFRITSLPVHLRVHQVASQHTLPGFHQPNHLPNISLTTKPATVSEPLTIRSLWFKGKRHGSSILNFVLP